MSAKRARSPSSDLSQPSAPSLRGWLNVTSQPPLPSPIVSSAPLTDRRSTFVAHACPVTNAHTAERFHDHIRGLRDSAKHPDAADHEMLSWRTIELKVGKKGLSEDDFVTRTGGEDDGEKNGSNTIRKAIEEAGGVDCCVVVSRYYGGQMLGPDRFSHIRTVTIQALAALATAQAVPALLKQLRQLDRDINLLTKVTLGTMSALPTYDESTMNESKAERLIKAREMRKELLTKKRDQMNAGAAEQEKDQEVEVEEEVEGEETPEQTPEQEDEGKDAAAPAVVADEDDEEAEAERAMQEYLAERAAAKAAKEKS